MRLSNNSREKFLLLLYFSILFLNTEFYFFDGIDYIPRYISLGVSIILTALLVVIKKKVKIHYTILILFAYVIIFNLSKIINYSRYDILFLIYPVLLDKIIFLSIFLRENSKIVKSVFNLYLKVVIIMTLPSIYYFFNILLNWGHKYELVSIEGRGPFINYNNIAIFAAIFNFGSFKISRLGGMFIEPGALGTWASILLVADILLFPKRKSTKIILIILGILSLSFAFFIGLIFIIIYYIIILFMNKKNNILVDKKDIIIILLVLLAVIILLLFLLPEDIQNAFNYIVLQRFAITEEGTLVGDNRRIDLILYNNYLQNDATYQDILIGKGPNAAYEDRIAVASVFSILYNTGFIGFSVLVIFLIYFFVYIPLKTSNFKVLIITIYPLLSIYQRTDIFSAKYLLLYAVIYISLKKYIRISKSMCNSFSINSRR